MEIDVVLPCLDEESALPWVLERMPDGCRPIVVDNGSTDRSAQVAARLGALVVSEPRRGFGAACHAGLLASTAEIVCFMDCDASLDPRQLPRVTGPVVAGRADLVLGRRVPHRDAAWPAHARLGNAVLARTLRRSTGAPLHDLGPMRAARRTALVDLGMTDRRFGYPLETVLRACAADWRLEEVDVDYLPRTGRSKVTGTVRGTLRAVGDMRRVMAELGGQARRGERSRRTGQIVVIAKEPVPGKVKTRLTPPFTVEEAAGLAAAALDDTLRTVAQVPAVRRVLALDGTPGTWVPDGFTVLPQRGRGLDERLAAAFDDAYRVPSPIVLIGMDTPQVTAGMLSSALSMLETSDAVFGPAADGGFWLLGLRVPDPRLLLGVPMSQACTGEAQLARLTDAGLSVAMMPRLTDVDTVTEAIEVAAAAPDTRFAAALAHLGARL